MPVQQSAQHSRPETGRQLASFCRGRFITAAVFAQRIALTNAEGTRERHVELNSPSQQEYLALHAVSC